MNQQLARDALQRYFGYDAFRLNQEDVILRTLAKQSSLVIMPTGGGKSICYQLPAVLLDGLTIVVSPLIALMQDQVSALQSNGISAEALNSACTPEQDIEIRARAEAGEIKLLYVSPEKAVSYSFVQWVSTLKVAQIAIDEAHCVSVWGNDFRPEYTRLTELTQCFPNITVVALTATADTATQQDIRQQLNLQDCETFVSSFERKNIEIDVLPAKKRIQVIEWFLDSKPGQAGIVYCLSRRSTEETALKIQGMGYKAAHYHGAMGSEERVRVQDAFLRDEIQIVCATIAFGMGIDKPNIRWVIHYNLPKNIESYYQEIGRAGRDGQAAQVLLFAGYGDMKTLTTFIDDSGANDTFKQVQYAKLERMWEFSQTLSCRTNFILNYFGEYRKEGCGHCDHCLNPPKSFDGTVIAQKALSACWRLHHIQRSIGMNLMIDVLRGSKSRNVIDQGLDAIKTYGAGADLSWKDWAHYLTQLVDRGYLAIDFTRGNVLTLTKLSADVLTGKAQVTLCELSEALPKEAEPKFVESDLSEAEQDLFESLKLLRREIADRKTSQAYTIFSDVSLKDMARRKPGNEGAFLKVSGVGEHKCKKYGEEFIARVRELVPEEERSLFETVSKKTKSTSRPAKSDFVMGKLSDTHLETLNAYEEVQSISGLSKVRGLANSTIRGHLYRLAYHGKAIDVDRLISEEKIQHIQAEWQRQDKPTSIRPIFDALTEQLDGDLDWEQIRYSVCLALR